MIRVHKARDGSNTYGVRVHRGGRRYDWIGTSRTRADARRAEAAAMVKQRIRPKLTVDDLADRFLAEYERTRRPNTVDRARYALEVFLRDRSGTLVELVDRADAERFARDRDWALPVLVTCFNYAERHGLVERSPFSGLSRKHSSGRRDLDPLTVDEVSRLAAFARQAHGWYGPTLASLVTFAAYTGLRASELYGLEWRDIDFDRRRIQVRRAFTRGRVGPPKNGHPRLIALLPPAHDALTGLPRTAEWVFPAKRGGRLSEPSLSSHYWPPVRALFGRPVHLHELRHFCGHHLYVRMDLASRVVATQLGHSSPRLVEELYGHFKVGALDEIDRAYGAHVVELRDTGGAHGA